MRHLIVDTNFQMTKGRIRDAETGEELSCTLEVKAGCGNPSIRVVYPDGMSEDASVCFNIIPDSPQEHAVARALAMLNDALFDDEDLPDFDLS